MWQSEEVRLGSNGDVINLRWMDAGNALVGNELVGGQKECPNGERKWMKCWLDYM